MTAVALCFSFFSHQGLLGSLELAEVEGTNPVLELDCLLSLLEGYQNAEFQLLSQGKHAWKSQSGQMATSADNIDNEHNFALLKQILPLT